MKSSRDVRRAHTDLFARCGCPQRRRQEASRLARGQEASRLARGPRDWHSTVNPDFREEMVQKTKAMLQHMDRDREVEARRIEEWAFWEANSLRIYMMLIAGSTGPT